MYRIQTERSGPQGHSVPDRYSAESIQLFLELMTNQRRATDSDGFQPRPPSLVIKFRPCVISAFVKILHLMKADLSPRASAQLSTSNRANYIRIREGRIELLPASLPKV
jgi:hypothetical protein